MDSGGAFVRKVCHLALFFDTKISKSEDFLFFVLAFGDNVINSKVSLVASTNYTLILIMLKGEHGD